jgi:BlaI family transcriptional regulator, penicillinase repressor
MNYENFRIDITKIFVDPPVMKPPDRKPTDAELGILRILWSRGPSTVRDVAAAMGREDAYTTVLKLLQIMTDKQLVRRNESARTHIYEAAHTEAQMQQHLVADLLDRAFDGSAATLVMRALSAKKTSAKDLAEIRKLLQSKEVKK